MANAVSRRTVDLSGYPDLVVIYLGMRVNAFAGLKTLLGFGPKIESAVGEEPDGLLLHEPIVYSLLPPHVGMRQYWRDFDSLERWARSDPHRAWWKAYVKNTRGTGFWHETYFKKGGVEAVYVDMERPAGLLRFAPAMDAVGPMFTARDRARVPGEPTTPHPAPT